jgi:tetratricopeptide (TPR) repeat protein
MDELQSAPTLSTIDRYLIGRAWQNLGFDDKALGQLEAALAGCTETYWRERLLFELAIQHQRHRDYDEAIRCYQYLARAGNLETATTAKIQILEAQLELRQFPDVPTAVVMNEAIELAKRFSTEDSGRFVNGILSALLESVRPNGK